MSRQTDELSIELFRIFARFEYCLKVIGFFKDQRGPVVDWCEFAKTKQVADLFDQHHEGVLGDAIGYILKNPPKKQVINDGQLAWAAVEPQTDIQSDLVLIYVRRVRNNLFHGGKFNGRWFEPERSEELMRHCIVILKACLEASDELKQAFDG